MSEAEKLEKIVDKAKALNDYANANSLSEDIRKKLFDAYSELNSALTYLKSMEEAKKEAERPKEDSIKTSGKTEKEESAKENAASDDFYKSLTEAEDEFERKMRELDESLKKYD